jgi:hypothetical protein
MKLGVLELGFAVVASVTMSNPATAQCADWRARPTLENAGHIGRVTSLKVWDPDGHGPQPFVLAVGGTFQHVGGTPGMDADNIATWDGTTWQALGGGTNGGVNALESYNGQLVAGGDFSSPTSRVARWNGSTWQPLGAGLGDIVFDLKAHDGELWTAWRGGVDQWNGTVWQHVSNVAPYVLLSASNELYAGLNTGGSSLDDVVRWNGSGFQNIGFGRDGAAWSLVQYGGGIVAGGNFDTAGGGPARNIAFHIGTSIWQPLGTGLPGTVDTLAVYNGELIAGGSFETGGSLAIHNIARWNGSMWLPMGGGTSGAVYALAVYGGELYAGGYFDQVDGMTCESLAKWNGSWQTLDGVTTNPLGGVVAAITPWRNGVAIGGDFLSAATNSPELAHNLAYFNGRYVTELGGTNARVDALANIPQSPLSSYLVVGGQFTSIAGVGANRIARLSSIAGSDWEPLGAGFANGTVHDVVQYNGSIYAAGSFTVTGSTVVNRIARWNGSTWQALGSGLDGPCYALEIYGGYLYVGGSFSTAGTTNTGCLARWNGLSWSTLGSSFAGVSVQDLTVYNNELIIGGSFPGPGGVANVLRWNGSSLEGFPSGPNDIVRAMTVSDGTLVLGGDFTLVGGQIHEHMVRWDGTAWRNFAHATDAPVWALTTFGNEIHVGGTFQDVRDDAIHSPLWARFSEDGVPWLAEQPRSTTVSCGDNAHFAIYPALGYGSISYEWRKDGVPLADGPTGTGSTILVSGTDLYVQYAGPSDAGVYDMVLTNHCGSTTSFPATLTVVHCCAEDLNGNSEITLQDLALLLAHFGESGSGLVGDIDRDGDVDLQDLANLLAVFGTQCE